MSQRRYRLIEVLGEGGFGTVYRAEVHGAGGFSKQVAIKVLRNDLDLPKEIALRLRDEARILGFLRHRAVVGVDSLAEFSEGWGIVMEYVPGVDGAEIRKKQPIPLRPALEILEEVASALHAAWHAATDDGQPLRLIHRDIKPANIRITPTGEVKILDFGIARAEFANREAETRSISFGSPPYMAPERMDGVEGPAGDIYALGIAFLELLVGSGFGSVPVGPDRHDCFVKGILERLSILGLPAGEVQEFFGRVLSYEPSGRPTAREVEQWARTMKKHVEGPFLREWAEEVIPKILENRPRKPTDRFLLEGAGDMELHRPDTGSKIFKRKKFRLLSIWGQLGYSCLGWLVCLAVGCWRLLFCRIYYLQIKA